MSSTNTCWWGMGREARVWRRREFCTNVLMRVLHHLTERRAHCYSARDARTRADIICVREIMQPEFRSSGLSLLACLCIYTYVCISKTTFDSVANK